MGDVAHRLRNRIQRCLFAPLPRSNKLEAHPFGDAVDPRAKFGLAAEAGEGHQHCGGYVLDQRAIALVELEGDDGIGVLAHLAAQPAQGVIAGGG